MPAPIRAVAFDLDGTLVDSGTAILDAVARGVREVTARHGREIDPSHDVLRAALGKPAREYFRAILPDGLGHLADEVLVAATVHEVEAVRANPDMLFDGVLETLDALRARGLRLACISNAQRGYFRAALDHLGLGERFDHSECQEELPADATAPYKTTMLRRALAALDVDAASVVMVGDREEDITSGRDVGCRTVGIRFGFGRPEELERADACVVRFAELEDLVAGWAVQN